MLKKLLPLAAGVLLAGQAVAQAPADPEEPDLPSLPKASQLDKDDVGKHYSHENGKLKEAVYFAGFNEGGQALAFALDDTPRTRASFQETQGKCQTKGSTWRMPTINELRMISRFSDEPYENYLPGSYWTTTPAPCFDCQYPNEYRMAYDISSGNVRNAYTAPFFKYYPMCVLDIQ